MCPRNITFGRPTPILAMPFPARSTWAAKPKERAVPRNARTAPASWPEGLYSLRSVRRTSTSSMAERPPQGVDRKGPLGLRNHQGREEADDARPAPDRDHPLVLEGLQHGGCLAPEFDPDHQAEPADLPHRGGIEAADLLHRGGPQGFRAFPEALPHDDVDRGRPRRACEGVAAERGGVAPLEPRLA